MIETNFTHVALRLGGAPMKGQTDTQIIVEAFPECVCVCELSRRALHRPRHVSLPRVPGAIFQTFCAHLKD
jgi:hypothetical protein